MPQHHDLTGRASGLWVVLGFSHYEYRKGRRFHLWKCRCKCGTERAVLGMHLSRGKSTSCGCQAGTHRLSKSSEFFIWNQMIARCHRPKTNGYWAYGGRGIAVCERWRSSFIDFYRDVGPRPSRLHTLDRLKVDGHYEPGNVRWATKAEQMQNQRRTKLSPEKVLAIREVATASNRKELAARYGVTPAMIDRVAKGRAWKNIGGRIRA